MHVVRNANGRLWVIFIQLARLRSKRRRSMDECQLRFQRIPDLRLFIRAPRIWLHVSRSRHFQHSSPDGAMFRAGLGSSTLVPGALALPTPHSPHQPSTAPPPRALISAKRSKSVYSIFLIAVSTTQKIYWTTHVFSWKTTWKALTST